MKAIKLLVIMLTICQLTFGQENVKSSIIDPFQKEALFREKVYLQLNKAIYFSNENIWFKAYVSDDAFNALSIYTSNLTVNLLDLNGNVVDSKEIFIKDGVGVGEFQIKEKYANGKYFVNAYTNYMQNFGEENIFIQDLNILKLNVSEKEPNKENQYEIQLFPESGYLLEDAKNSIGIKSLVNGKGVSFSGHIVNSKNEKVVDFHGNKFGMSKASFNYEKGEEYTSIIDVNGTTQKTALPIANTNGVIFSVDNNDEDILKVTLSTNEESLENLKTDELSIIIYRNSFICDAVTLKLNSNESIEQEVLFYKDKMLYGVNTITLFRNNQPIAERKVFINKPVENTSVLIDKLDESRDSTSYRVSTINSDFNPISTKMSVSVLSAESQIVLESQNIKTAYLLSPYVKGFIEKPSYYFNQETGNELKDLDLLLINQSWSAYSLNDKIAEVNPEQTFEFENGFNLNGFAKKAPNGYDIALLNKKNKIASTTTIDNKDYFNLTNIFAYKHDSIKFTYIKKNKPLISPKNINLSSPRLSKQNFSSLISNYNYSDPLNDDSIEKLNLDSSTLDMTSTEKLREVVLSNVKSERKENNFDREMNIASKRNEIASEFYVNKKVTERIEMENKSALDYLGSLGYVKYTTYGNIFLSLRNATASIGTNINPGLNPNNTYPPKVYIDGLSIMSPNSGGASPSVDARTGITMTGNTTNYGVITLKNLEMNEVDEILINKSGAGGGITGMGGTIKIYLKKGGHKYYDAASKKLYKELLLNVGFDRAKKYYTPLYNNLTKENLNWIEIDWKNNVQTNENGEVIIKIPSNNFSNDFQFIINGVSENGLLIHHIYKTNQSDF